jgi:cyanophycinase-like exopeptidase
MNRYTVTHEHGEGITQYNFECVIDIFAQNWYGDDDQLERLAKALSINYEPHKGETLTLATMDETVVFLDMDTTTKILGNNA